MAQGEKNSANPVSKGVSFVQEAWQELKKVHYPTRQETVQGTLGVLFLILIFSAFLGIGDIVLAKIMRHVLT